MSLLPFSPQLFAIFAPLIEERGGLHYEVAERELLGGKLSSRAVDRGFDSLLDYYYFLRYDPEGSVELDALVETLLVHETYFFRELEPLRVLIDSVVAPLVASGARARVWCAACATGEEPLSLAMLLAARGLLASVDIVASDLSQRALERAQRGEYNGRSLRDAPPLSANQWLTKKDGRVEVRPEIHSTITWQRLNLLDRPSVLAQGSFDAILCRNVLIYFREETAKQVVATLTDALRPAGYLLVGVSESLLRFGTSLRCEERGGVFLYQKASA